MFYNSGQTVNLLNVKESVLLGIEELRDKRDSLTNPGFVSYGFGTFGGYRSRYGWKRRRGGDRRTSKIDQSQADGRSSSEQSKAKKVSTSVDAPLETHRQGLASWWKAEDNPMVG